MAAAIRLWCLLILFGVLVGVQPLPLCRERYRSGGSWRNCTVQIGGLAIHGHADFENSYRPAFEEYLTRRLQVDAGLEFEAIPLNFSEVFDYVGSSRIDFVFCNTAAFTCLMVEFSAAALASMINLRAGHALERFAGVIISRADSTFRTVHSLRNARVEAVSISGLGGMQLQQAELLAHGLDVMTEARRLTFTGNQMKIVEDVQSGYADVGFVRTDMLERCELANISEPGTFQVINRLRDETFPFARSTAYTPEWPLGALSHVPHEVRSSVLLALLALDVLSPNSALREPCLRGNFARWVTPMNYLGLLAMLESTGFYSAQTRRCLRSSSVYSSIACPTGFVKRSERDVLCQQDCKAGYICICRPCAPLKSLALALWAEALPTQWSAGVNSSALQAATNLGNPCARMALCVEVSVGQRLRWTLLDQIGQEIRLQINAPLLSSVQMRPRFGGGLLPMRREEALLADGTQTQRYVLEIAASESTGTELLEVLVDGAQAEMSPLVVKTFALPEVVLVCGPGQGAEGGACRDCPPGSIGMQTEPACRLCPEGSHQPLQGQSLCWPCPAGFASAFRGALACEPCPPGSSTLGKEGAAGCLRCEPGQHAGDEASPRCSLCPRGSFSAASGASECGACPAGTTTAEVGAEDAAACGCPEGSYLVAGACRACPGRGSLCPGFGAEMLVERGFYMRPGASRDVETVEIFECLQEAHCPGGAPGTCAPNRDSTKIACGACDADSYELGADCIDCGDSGSLVALPTLLFFLLIATCLMAFTWFDDVFPAKKSISRQNLAAVATLLMVSAQTMRAFRDLAVKWLYPLDSLLRGMSMFTGDFSVAKELKLGCFMPDDPVASFVLHQFGVPAFIFPVVFSAFLKHRCHPSWACTMTITNAAGTLVSVFHMSFVLSAASSVVCYNHPGDTGSSMRTDPSILCYRSGAHATIVAIGLFSFFLIPVPYVVLTAFLIWRLPGMVRRLNACDARLLVATRFMCDRYEPRQYYFCLVVLARNTLTCLIPIVLHDVNTQVGLMCLLLWIYALAQQSLQPWRGRLLNAFDGSSCASLSLILTFGALGNAGLCAVSFSVLAALSACTLGATLIRFAHKRSRFDFFICHDTRHASAQARLMRMCLEESGGLTCFSDMGSVGDLDGLLDIVKCRTNSLVAYLTQDMLTRPVCAGLIAMAHMSGSVPATPVWTRSFFPPTEEQLVAIGSYIGIRRSRLGQCGVLKGDVQRAYRALIEDPERVVVPPELTTPMASLEHFAARLGREGDARVWESEERTPLPRSPGALVVSVDSDSLEAVSAVALLLGKAKTRLLAFVPVVCNLSAHASEDFGALGEVVARARALVVFFSSGSLCSLQQLAVIEEAMFAVRSRDLSGVVPVCLPGFALPGEVYYAKVLPALMPRLPAIGSRMRRLFLTVKFSSFLTSCRDDVLDTQVADIVDRIEASTPMASTASRYSTSRLFRETVDLPGTAPKPQHGGSKTSLGTDESEGSPHEVRVLSTGPKSVMPSDEATSGELLW